MRKTIQFLSVFLFTALFVLATYRLPDWLWADIYLRIDPLLAINALVASREIIGRVLASLFLVVATLALGRFFCAYLCPLGALLDSSDFILFWRIRRRPLKGEAEMRRWKVALLIGIVAAALVGVNAVYLFDPIALLTRVYTFLLYPLAVAGINLALDLFRPLFGAAGWTGLAHLHYPQPVYGTAALTLAIFGGLIALGRLAPRFWCRYLCPLGALLGLLSPISVFRRRVSDACNRCMACRDACPMGAIGEDPSETRTSECIECRKCARICPQQAVAFLPSFRGVGEYGSPDISRRGALVSLAGGLTFGFVSLQSPSTLLAGKRQLLRPPGAIPEGEFQRTCIRCGECMKACVTNTLQPCLWEAGLTGLWTPKLEPRMAACEPNCNVCGKVCPTQAIRALSLEEKTHAKVGTAVLNKETCLVWAQNRQCLICDEICPYNAIVFRTIDGARRPFVIASRCNGCGYCEQRCPVAGESAIVVLTEGEIRLKEGSYIQEAKRLQLEFKPDPGDDRFEIDRPASDTGGERGSQKRGEGQGPSNPAEGPVSGKPKGFL
jgi:polyferredoxin